MPVIAYQSFNANSSTTHGIASMWNQPLTRGTAQRVIGAGRQALVLPTLSDDLSVPVEGPAHLRPIDSLTGPATQTVFGTQIALIFQNVYRAVGSMPDLVVCGELDINHADFADFRAHAGLVATVVANDKACQCFTAFSQAGTASQIRKVREGVGFVIFSVGGINVMFVHVPNEFATDAKRTAAFYADLNTDLVRTGVGVIDLVIGDTNQNNSDFTRKALGGTFANAQVDKTFCPFDNYEVTEKGTNSAGTKMFDVAVYDGGTIRVDQGPVYLSQSSSGTTVTDHCGLAIKISRK